MSMIKTGSGAGLRGHLMELLDYRAVLGALATTLDGLVVAQAGLTSDDAELLAAAAANAGDEARQLPAQGGSIHVRRGTEMRLIALVERGTPEAELDQLLQAQLAALEESIAA